MDIKQLSSKIKLIKTNGAKLDALIQEVALGCIEHAAALRVQENIKATVKLEGHLAA